MDHREGTKNSPPRRVTEANDECGGHVLSQPTSIARGGPNHSAQQGDHEIQHKDDKNEDVDTPKGKTYPILFVVGMAVGIALGEALIGGTIGTVVGFVVGGGIGAAIQSQITSGSNGGR